MKKAVPYLLGIAIFIVIALSMSQRHTTGNIAAPTISFPALGQSQRLADGTDFYEVKDASGRTLWIYLPSNRGTGKIPCVVIAPAGSPCIAGMGLANGDRPEHLPYVKAGFAVVAYSLDGPLPDSPTLPG